MQSATGRVARRAVDQRASYCDIERSGPCSFSGAPGVGRAGFCSRGGCNGTRLGGLNVSHAELTT
jgi:hypothetical protein